jgi:uncharacterized protein (TIGR03067 family)
MHPAAIFFVTLPLAAPALKDTPRDQGLVGEWETVRSVGSGSPDEGKVRFVFTADGKWTSIRDGRQWEIEKTAYVIDSKAEPPTIDLIYDVAAGAAATFRGIYKLNRDTLTVCSANPGYPRPTAFESPKMSNVNLTVLRRVKK